MLGLSKDVVSSHLIPTISPIDAAKVPAGVRACRKAIGLIPRAITNFFHESAKLGTTVVIILKISEMLRCMLHSRS